MKSYKVKKGKHDFKPTDSIGIANPCLKEIKYKVVFTESCKYILPGEDQDDWNKGGGVSFSLLSNRKNSVMWAWRYKPVFDRIQLCAYWHENGVAHYAETENDFPFACNPGEEITISIRKAGKDWFVDFRAHDGYFQKPVTAKGTPIRPIGVYFGGNRPAPQDIEIFIHKTIHT